MTSTQAMFDIVAIDPEIMGGVPVFKGTRVPVRALIDTLEAGEGIDGFLSGYPTVKREQVVAFLERGAELALAEAQ